MTAIFKREFRSYFQNITGWLYLAATTALYGLYFYAYQMNFGYAKISYSLNAITFLVLVTVPVLTMRSLAEEKKSRTDQLILTSPVSVGKIVLAKYFAMAAVHTAAIAVIAATPLILLCFGTVPLAESYAAVFGFWLYGLLCIAIGLFVSSLTESQVISAVLTFAFLFLGFMMKSVTGMFSSSGNFLTKILNCYDLVTPLHSFLDGCFSVTGMIYYLTVSALFLILTAQSVQKRRFTVSVRKIKTGVFSLSFAAAATALTVLVNLFAAELPSTYMEIDLTSSKLYSLTEETKTFLKEIKKDAVIYVIAAKDDVDTTVAETLKRYEDSSAHIQVEYKDPAVNPNFYKEYADTVSMGSLIVVSGEAFRVIDYQELFESSVDYTTYSQQTTGYDGEGQITSALEYVTGEHMPVVYEVTGHGETELSGNFLKALQKANMMQKELYLLKEDSVPEDAAAVLINGPVSDFSKDDADKIIAYMKTGGNVLLSLNYQAKEELVNLSSIWKEYGMEIVNGVIAEGDAKRYYQNPFYLLPYAESSAYTVSVGSSYIFAPFVQGIILPENSDTVTYTPILTTSEEAVAKADTANATTYAFEEGDVKGPFTIAAAAEKTVDDTTKGRLVVFGSSEILGESADTMVSGSNSAMFSDTMTNMAATGEDTSVVIPVKSYDNAKLIVPAFSGRLIGISVMLILPVLCLAAGIILWAGRRKR